MNPKKFPALHIYSRSDRHADASMYANPSPLLELLRPNEEGMK